MLNALDNFRRLFSPPRPNFPQPEFMLNSVPFRPFGASGRQFNILGHPSDGSAFGAIRATGLFEHHVVKVASELIHDRDIVLDIGANIGALTCVFATLAWRGKVYCFEASRTAMSYLKANIQANHLRNTEVVHTAVSDTVGEELDLHVVDEFMGGAFLSTLPITEGRLETVVTTTLDAWLAEKRLRKVHAVKMDIEGAEIFALSGGSDLIRKMQPLLFIECNPVALKRFHGKRVTELYDTLAKFYKYIYVIPDFGSTGPVLIRSLEDLMLSLRHGRGNDDLICSPRPLQNACNDFGVYYNELCLRNANREIVLDPDWSIKFQFSRVVAQPGQLIMIRATVTNLSTEYWAHWDQNPVNISYHVVTLKGKTIVYDGVRTPILEPLPPNGGRIMDLVVQAPMEKGLYRLEFSPVQEGIIWFDKANPKITAVGLEVL